MMIQDNSHVFLLNYEINRETQLKMYKTFKYLYNFIKDLKFN